MASPNDINILKQAMASQNLISFTYQKKNSVINRYMDVEPYVIKLDDRTGAPVFFGFHSAHSSIHKFYLQRMSDALIQPGQYIPRWQVEGVLI